MVDYYLLKLLAIKLNAKKRFQKIANTHKSERFGANVEITRPRQTNVGMRIMMYTKLLNHRIFE